MSIAGAQKAEADITQRKWGEEQNFSADKREMRKKTPSDDAQYNKNPIKTARTIGF